MEKSKQTYCPKCNNDFECKTGDIVNCQCYQVPLSEETKVFLSETAVGCLCSSCLAEVERQIRKESEQQAPTQKSVLIEGLHFYKEGGNFVFTEAYHLQRGYCCKNGCRHCPYRLTQKDY